MRLSISDRVLMPGIRDAKAKHKKFFYSFVVACICTNFIMMLYFSIEVVSLGSD
jgi:hypothetical protein